MESRPASSTIKNGIRSIVDTGISTYETCKRRKIERSTSSHNTIEFEGKNQSEVWASFRVANRVFPEGVRLISETDYDRVEASYTGKKHTREINFQKK